MKNLIKLHEAIALALLAKENRTATFDEIAAFIIKRDLFPIREGNINLSKQIMLRSTKSNGHYLYLFEQLSIDTIKLRNI